MTEKQATFFNIFVHLKKGEGVRLHFQRYKPAKGKMRLWLKTKIF